MAAACKYFSLFFSFSCNVFDEMGSRRRDCKEGEDGFRYSAVVNGDYEENLEKDQEDDIDGDISVLKREISRHALYRSLVQSHLECLKLCCNTDNIDTVTDPIASDAENLLKKYQQTELDHFMEAYCMALKKLKESMEEPQEESMAFINYMYSQLKEVVGIPSSPTLSPTK